VVDSVFVKESETVRFHPCPSVDAADVDEALAVDASVQRPLAGRGADAGGEGGDTLDEWADDAPVWPDSLPHRCKGGRRSARGLPSSIQ